MKRGEFTKIETKGIAPRTIITNTQAKVNYLFASRMVRRGSNVNK